MMAGPRQVRHFTVSPSRHDRTDLHLVVGVEKRVTRNEGSVADHQVGFARQTEFGQERVNASTPGDLEIPSRVTEGHDHVEPRRRVRSTDEITIDRPGSIVSTATVSAR